MLERFCSALAKEWEIEGDFFSGIDGLWSIPIDEDMEVLLTETANGYLMSTTLAKAPKKKREEFFALLLAGNMLGVETRGAVLSLDDKEQVCLSRLVTQVSRQRDFQEYLEDFIEMADRWQAITTAS